MFIKYFKKSLLPFYMSILLFLMMSIKWVDAANPRVHPATLKPGTLIVATYFTNPPFEFLKNGPRIGFEVDLIKEIAKRLKMTVEFRNTQWETIIEELKNNKYDLIMGAITITPERKKIIDFSEPYMNTTLSIIINNKKTPQMQSLDDLRHTTVGVQAATTDYDVAVKMQKMNHIKGIKIYSFHDFFNAINDFFS